MDRLMNRDGYSKEEASEILASAGDLSPARRAELKTLLHPRHRTRFIGLEALDREGFVAFRDPIESREADRARRRRTTAILKAYRSLDRQDRRLIALRYLRNLPFSEIGEQLQLEPRVLYRRIERTLGRLRTSMPDLTVTG
jgi:RNA polymerase sigma factor (sigma-70 family)